MQECAICDKHAGTGNLRGELIIRTREFWVYHAPLDEAGQAPLGHLYVESDRHAPYLDDLTERESAALGSLRTTLARALRAETGASFVFAAVIGTGVSHFHEHLISRHPETPPSVPWHDSALAGPRGDKEAVAALVRHLAQRLGPSDGPNAAVITDQ